MITLNLGFIHVVLAVVVAVLSIASIKFLFIYISTTKLYLKWHYKRQANIQRVKANTEIEMFYKDINGLSVFVNWINSVMLKTSKQRKRFWYDFALSAKGRKFWVDKFSQYIEMQMKEQKV